MKPQGNGKDYPQLHDSSNCPYLKEGQKNPRNSNMLRDDPEKQLELTEKVEGHLKYVTWEEINIGTLNTDITKALRTSAGWSLSYRRGMKQKYPWQDQTVLYLHAKLRECKDRTIEKAVKILQKEIKDCRKRVKIGKQKSHFEQNFAARTVELPQGLEFGNWQVEIWSPAV